MRPEEVRQLLEKVRSGEIEVSDALDQLQYLPVQDLGFARVDTHRELRQGIPEAIYAENKTADQVVAIARELLRKTTGPVLITRTSAEVAKLVLSEWSDAAYNSVARLIVLRPETESSPLGLVAVVSAGTSDSRVAEEAAAVADALGMKIERIDDVGVAGVHRVLAVQDRLHAADVVIVVAGMEGALASLVGGLTGKPVIAVPTSVGYGAAFDGLAALLAMLNSCAAGVVVTNIDNGFGAAVFALRMLRQKSD
ncbi:MAG TPA: nickel pincer cofactor biosynthesis protein LarB [Actinomycetota bacterium]|nr:nickel pincer cofactor biosynthesis protein LarB [Actinomycetota bacterium]